MNIEIKHGPANSAAQIKLSPNETCVAEAGAMIAMSGNVGVTTSTHKKNSGSMMKALKRMLTGESFFMNHFTAGGDGGEVWLSTTLSGDMTHLKLDGSKKIVTQSGSFVAASDGIDMDLGWQGFKSMFSGENLLWINLSGSGDVVLNSFGSIYAIDVDGEYIVDTGHIVAFEESLQFKISKVSSSWLSTIFGGEGLVCRFSGKGKVWCQSHNPTSFGQSLTPFLKPIKK